MTQKSYHAFWEQAARTPESALLAVDGSADESILQATGRWTAAQVAQALLLQPDDQVLELGCGVGRIGRELAPQCRSWHGVDIAANMLTVAKQRTSHLPNVAFQHLHRTSLSMFADASFDKAYAVAVLIHLDKEDVFLYLREVARILRPGGLVYVDTWNLVAALDAGSRAVPAVFSGPVAHPPRRLGSAAGVSVGTLCLSLPAYPPRRGLPQAFPPLGFAFRLCISFCELIG